MVHGLPARPGRQSHTVPAAVVRGAGGGGGGGAGGGGGGGVNRAAEVAAAPAAAPTAGSPAATRALALAGSLRALEARTKPTGRTSRQMAADSGLARPHAFSPIVPGGSSTSPSTGHWGPVASASGLPPRCGATPSHPHLGQKTPGSVRSGFVNSTSTLASFRAASVPSR